MAPTKPLVSQQIQACHEIVGIPEFDTAHLFGGVSPEERGQHWKDKRVVFCTPQTFENDLRSGVCDYRRVVCLVFDEAHRASGSYAYCTVVKLLSMQQWKYRVLALTATPGADTKAIQNVIYNLKIASIEVRSEDDEDVAAYTNMKQIEIIKCKKALSGQNKNFLHVKDLFSAVLHPLVVQLYESGCFVSDIVESVTDFVVREGERSAILFKRLLLLDNGIYVSSET